MAAANTALHDPRRECAGAGAPEPDVEAGPGLPLTNQRRLRRTGFFFPVCLGNDRSPSGVGCGGGSFSFAGPLASPPLAPPLSGPWAPRAGPSGGGVDEAPRGSSAASSRAGPGLSWRDTPPRDRTPTSGDRAPGFPLRLPDPHTALGRRRGSRIDPEGGSPPLRPLPGGPSLGRGTSSSAPPPETPDPERRRPFPSFGRKSSPGACAKRFIWRFP